LNAIAAVRLIPAKASVVWKWLLGILPEGLTALAFVGGWTLITAGVVALSSPLAWLFSGGLLAISLGGWKLFYIFVRDGLYLLTQASKRGK
jgi:hypothetical protein